jgi:hypothetical protein
MDDNVIENRAFVTFHLVGVIDEPIENYLLDRIPSTRTVGIEFCAGVEKYLRR